MRIKDDAPKQPRLPESAMIWDVSNQAYEVAYRRDFKRHKIIQLLESTTFNNLVTTATGKTFEVPAYSRAMLYLFVDVTLAPTDIVFSIYFSDDTLVWYKYMMGPFGDLRYDDAAGDKFECLDLPIIAKYMRVTAVATGTSAVNLFNAQVKAILEG